METIIIAIVCSAIAIGCIVYFTIKDKRSEKQMGATQ